MYRDDHEAALLRAAKLNHENAELRQENAELKKRLAKRKRRVTKLLWRDLGQTTKKYAIRTAVAASVAALTLVVVSVYAHTAPEVPTTSSANLSDAGVQPPPIPDHGPPFAFLCTANETELACLCRGIAPTTHVFLHRNMNGLCAPYPYWDIAMPSSSIGPMPNN